MELIKNSTYFTEDHLRKIMRQVVSAILYCHKNNIVHRDIKADNILFSKKDIDSPIKLIDFGISLKYNKDTILKDKIGTILYVAPEVLKGNYNNKCDVWSCGVLMYLILCGYPPFFGSSRKSVAKKIMKKQPKFKGDNWDLASRNAIELIGWMLSKDPNERPSCEEILGHDWFTDATVFHNELDVTSAKKYLENMRRFQTRSKLSQAIMTYIVSNIAYNDVQDDALQVFRSLDLDGDGKITEDELAQGFKKFYKSVDKDIIKAEVKEIIGELDSNVSGSIDYTEFLLSGISKKSLLSRRKVNLLLNRVRFIRRFTILI